MKFEERSLLKRWTELLYLTQQLFQSKETIFKFQMKNLIKMVKVTFPLIFLKIS